MSDSERGLEWWLQHKSLSEREQLSNEDLQRLAHRALLQVLGQDTQPGDDVPKMPSVEMSADGRPALEFMLDRLAELSISESVQDLGARGMYERIAGIVGATVQEDRPVRDALNGLFEVMCTSEDDESGDAGDFRAAADYMDRVPEVGDVLGRAPPADDAVLMVGKTAYHDVGEYFSRAPDSAEAAESAGGPRELSPAELALLADEPTDDEYANPSGGTYADSGDETHIDSANPSDETYADFADPEDDARERALESIAKRAAVISYLDAARKRLLSKGYDASGLALEEIGRVQDEAKEEGRRLKEQLGVADVREELKPFIARYRPEHISPSTLNEYVGEGTQVVVLRHTLDRLFHQYDIDEAALSSRESEQGGNNSRTLEQRAAAPGAWGQHARLPKDPFQRVTRDNIPDEHRYRILPELLGRVVLGEYLTQLDRFLEQKKREDEPKSGGLLKAVTRRIKRSRRVPQFESLQSVIQDVLEIAIEGARPLADEIGLSNRDIQEERNDYIASHPLENITFADIPYLCGEDHKAQILAEQLHAVFELYNLDPADVFPRKATQRVGPRREAELIMNDTSQESGDVHDTSTNERAAVSEGDLLATRALRPRDSESLEGVVDSVQTEVSAGDINAAMYLGEARLAQGVLGALAQWYVGRDPENAARYAAEFDAGSRVIDEWADRVQERCTIPMDLLNPVIERHSRLERPEDVYEILARVSELLNAQLGMERARAVDSLLVRMYGDFEGGEEALMSLLSESKIYKGPEPNPVSGPRPSGGEEMADHDEIVGDDDDGVTLHEPAEDETQAGPQDGLTRRDLEDRVSPLDGRMYGIEQRARNFDDVQNSLRAHKRLSAIVALGGLVVAGGALVGVYRLNEHVDALSAEHATLNDAYTRLDTENKRLAAQNARLVGVAEQASASSAAATSRVDAMAQTLTNYQTVAQLSQRFFGADVSTPDQAAAALQDNLWANQQFQGAVRQYVLDQSSAVVERRLHTAFGIDANIRITKDELARALGTNPVLQGALPQQSMDAAAVDSRVGQYLATQPGRDALGAYLSSPEGVQRLNAYLKATFNVNNLNELVTSSELDRRLSTLGSGAPAQQPAQRPAPCEDRTRELLNRDR